MELQRLSLEDHAFGRLRAKDEDAPRQSSGVVGPTTAAWSERAASCMLPACAVVALALVVVYSLTKAIEYQDLFQSNRRYRYGLFAVNVVGVVLTSLVVAYGVASGV